MQDAVDWVEYLNGDATTTTFGKMRALRGHPEPYNVTYWYLGNEINLQRRYPDYPQKLTSFSPTNAIEYKTMLQLIIPAMMAAAPMGPKLNFFAVDGPDDFTRAWAGVPDIGNHIYATSYHGGYMDQPAVFDEESVTACAKRPRGDFLKSLQDLRKSLDSMTNPNNHTLALSADEWGLGPPWVVSEFSVAHGMYAAGFLGTVTRAASSLGLNFTNYFEPVNEGAVQVRLLLQ